jgi:hypothetical protein
MVTRCRGAGDEITGVRRASFFAKRCIGSDVSSPPCTYASIRACSAIASRSRQRRGQR